jgi:DNA primase
MLAAMDAVEEIKSRLAIEDVVGEYVQLKRTGRNWKGLSPWTNERTPSFVVSPEKQIWHDFSSGKGGDIFSFIMEVEGLDFRQSLELLARKAGVVLEQFHGNNRNVNTKLKERLYEILEYAALFYQTQLKANRSALEYVLKSRQFTKATAIEWRLGYAPNTGSALSKFLISKKFTGKEIRDAGLSARAYSGGVQDMFRGRIMVPLADQQGRIIGFTARLIGESPNAPKYINTPQTLLYDKSRHIFGLHLAKEAIRKKKYVVVTEGNLDVIMSHQVGIKQVVATAGTALTEQHLKILDHFTNDIRLSFDADRAGVNATERAIPIASKVGVSLSIIDIPNGKDPDELIKQNPVNWQKSIEKPIYALDWLFDRYASLLDLNSGPGKRKFSDILLPIVHTLADNVEQDHYLNKIAKLIDVSRDALEAKLQKSTSQRGQVKRLKTAMLPHKLDKQIVESIKIQNHLLAIVFKNPELRTHLNLLNEDMFADNQGRSLFVILKTSGVTEVDLEKRISSVQKIAEYAKILLLQYEELYQGLDELELNLEAARLKARVVEQFVKLEKQTLVAELDDSDEVKMKAMLVRAKELDNLLSQTKGGRNG